MNTKTILLSGGFDPIHISHVRMIQDAANYGLVIVAVNTDEWLLRKKGYVFIPLDKRIKIIKSISGVYLVTAAWDDDDTVCETIKTILPNMFGNGGDRKQDNVPEVDLCNKLNIELVWNLGRGGKI
jgi:D-beta-D-heptose 7-phosphate kinase/D-beta-D-heptose 1-phosphate adenosyltransferase